MSLKFLLRDIKNPELILLVLTIMLSILCVSSLLFFTQGIRYGLEDSTGSLLGGDRVLNSSTPIDPEILQKTKSLGLKSSETVVFYSMLVKAREKSDTNNSNRVGDSHNRHNSGNNNHEENHEELALAEVKAVDDAYPLKGNLHIAKKLYGEDEAYKGIPEPGTVWLEANLFSLLDIDIGDSISIGYLPLKVARVLTFEPDRGGEGLTFAPRALINQSDLSKTKVITQGSRQQYKLLLTGSEKNLEELSTWLKPKLTASQKLLEPKDVRPVVKTLLDQAEDYLVLVIILNLLIAALAVSQAARQFAWRQYHFVAVLRCFGASFRWILGHFILEIIVYSFAATILGFFLGLLIFYLSKGMMEDLLLQNIEFFLAFPLLISLMTGLLLTIIFVLPSFLKLRTVSPLWIFRQKRGRVESGLLSVSSKWRRAISQWAVRFGVELRYGINHLIRYPLENSIQISAFTLVMVCAWLLFLLRTDLILTWQKQMPSNAPNYFAINIFPEATSKFQAFLEKNNIKSEKLYPIVRGRLLAINNESLETEGNSIPGRAQFKRLLNLTFDEQLPKDNEIVAGEWFSVLDQGKLEQGRLDPGKLDQGKIDPGKMDQNNQDTSYASVSIEQGFAERLNIHLNDKLKFQIAGKDWEVKVKSIRKVVWDTFHPNFFVIFPPKVLDGLPITYITSFYLEANKRFILRELVREFPEINLIDMSLVLKNIENMIKKISVAIEYLWAITMIMAFLLLFCTLVVNLEEKKANAILLRALGVGHKKLLGIIFSEFLILGAVSGFLAIIIATIAYVYIGTSIFNLAVNIQPWMFLLGPFIGMLLISMGSYLGLRKVMNVSPAMALSLR